MRPQILFPLFADVASLQGIGPRFAKLIGKIAGPRLVDLIWHKPVSINDWRQQSTIRDAPDKETVTLKLTIVEHTVPRVQRLPYKIRAADDTGFIDLVFEANGRFWIIDWKSNRLGATSADYTPDRILRIIEDELYDLQYLLYTLAVHRFLALRLPGYEYDRHFGGVLYLFLRGIEPAQGSNRGVFFDRPRREVLEALDRRIATG